MSEGVPAISTLPALPNKQAQKKLRRVRLSERIQSVILAIQVLLLLRIYLLLTGEWRHTPALPFISATDILVKPFSLLIHPISMGWYILDTPGALLILVFTIALSLTAFILDLVRARKKYLLGANISKK